MTPVVDVFWSFRSPYSYLITPDLMKLRDDYAITLALRPVLPIALRDDMSFFDASDKKRPRYVALDAKRRAQFLGLPYRWPNPDPVVQDMTNYEIATEQPHIWRLIALGLEAEKRGAGVDFIYHVAGMMWSGVRGWDQGDHLEQAVAKAGLNLAELEQAAQKSDPKAAVQKNHQALEEAGHWGVPTLVLNGEPFFGQDRIETLRWRLDQEGLRKG